MKTFLIIGVGPGIGFATAERFAQAGYQVVLAARNVQHMQELAAQLTAKGYTASGVGVDAADPAQVAQLIADTEARFGALDTMLYNAAALRPTSIDSLDVPGFQQDMAVNIVGAYAAIRAALAAMAQRAAGTILLTGGGLALHPNPDYLTLGVGKAAIRSLALALFEDFKKRGIHLATLTVHAHVAPDSAEALAAANEFFRLQSQEKDAWTAEATLAG